MNNTSGISDLFGDNVNNFSVVYDSDEKLAAVEMYKDYPNGLLHFMTAFCAIIMLVGVPGNIITFAALARNEKVRNATAIFIMNLSTSDLLFCCFNLPLAASTFWQRSWTHGRVLCRMYPMARYVLVAVSLFSVLAITINRYILISHPRFYPRMYTSRNIVIMVAAIWMSPIIVLLPTFFGKWGCFGMDSNISSCSMLIDSANRSPKKIFFAFAFLLPCAVIIVSYARIFCIVRKATNKTLNKPKNKSNCVDTTSESSTSASVRCHKLNILIPPKDDDHDHHNDQESTSIISSDDRNVHHNAFSKNLRRTALRKSMAVLKLSLPTRKDRRLGTMIMAIMLCFCIFHLPITIIKILPDVHTKPAINIAALILLYLAPSINPVIYVVMSNEYRKAYKSLFTGCFKA